LTNTVHVDGHIQYPKYIPDVTRDGKRQELNAATTAVKRER